MKRPNNLNRKAVNSVDGMVSRPRGVVKRSSGQTSGALGRAPKRDARNVNRPQLGGIKSKPDGFTPNSRPHLGAQAFYEKESPNKQPTAKEVESNLNRKPKRHSDGTIDINIPDGDNTRKKRRRFRLRFMRPTKKNLAVFAAVFVLGIGVIAAKGWYDISQVLKGGGNSAILAGDTTQLNGEGDGRINILLLGKGGDGHEAPDLTDTILVASIDPINNQASLLSIPRDFWVTPEGGGGTKINAVYANAKYRVLNGVQIENQEEEAEKAGLAAIEAEVSKDMGIPIHYHVMVDFKGFKDAVDNVGGITIDVPEESTVYENLWDPTVQQHYLLNVGEGPQDFDGRRALFFARSRKTSTRGDFDRTQRQRLVIQALKDKVLSAGTFANPAKVSGLIDTFGSHVRTNFTLEEIMRLYEISNSIPSSSIASLGLADPPNVLVQTGQINGLSVVIPVAGQGQYADIQKFVRNSLRDGFLASEDGKVFIYNGTSIAGLASEKQEELESFGYNVAFVGTAPTQDYEQTTLIDLTNGQKPVTKQYLENRLGVEAVTSLPDSNISATGADFVIILGTNEANSTEN